MNAPVTVVLLNYNGGQKLTGCLRSFAALGAVPAAIVFVDNGSADYDAAAYAKLLGERCAARTRFVRLETNVGYVKGMNVGVRVALEGTSPWVMTLSNDTELDPRFFERLEPLLSQAPARLGMIAPKVRSLVERQLLDGTGLALSFDGMSTARGQREVDRGQYDHCIDVLMPNGVSGIYRADALKDVGLLDESYWSYCEDTELGLRAWLAGWDCRFVSEAIVYHARSSTLGEHSLAKLYHTERNHYWVALKHLPWPILALNPAFTVYRFCVQLYAVAAGRGQGRGFGEGYGLPTLMLTTLRALRDAALGAPRVLRERRALKNLRRRSRFETFRALWQHRLSFGELILK